MHSAFKALGFLGNISFESTITSIRIENCSSHGDRMRALSNRIKYQKSTVTLITFLKSLQGVKKLLTAPKLPGSSLFTIQICCVTSTLKRGELTLITSKSRLET